MQQKNVQQFMNEINKKDKKFKQKFRNTFIKNKEIRNKIKKMGI